MPVAVLFCTGCRINSGIATADLTNTYSGNAEATISASELANLNDSLSRIVVEVNMAGYIASGQMLPQPATLNLELFRKSKSTQMIADTAFVISDTASGTPRQTFSWTFTAFTGNEYMIKATYTGNVFHDEVSLMTELDKRSTHTAPWFRMIFDDGSPVAGNISNSIRPVRITSSRPLNETIFVKYFGRNFELPQPPFSFSERPKFDYISDSSFTLTSLNDTSIAFSPLRTGLYFFTTDTTEWQGSTLLVAGHDYPKITSHAKMAECLRYITTAKEFAQLTGSNSAKMAVDSFWIANTGSVDIATEMIKRYYSRVEEANRLFTSVTEGWKTDRGMIYIVIGKPAQVYRSIDREVWIYGDVSSPSALKFFFTKVQNPFTSNDFVLERREYYKTSWYQNVQAWRR